MLSVNRVLNDFTTHHQRLKRIHTELYRAFPVIKGVLAGVHRALILLLTIDYRPERPHAVHCCRLTNSRGYSNSLVSKNATEEKKGNAYTKVEIQLQIQVDL